MSEKVRGALFNMLGDISGLTVLDAFAGSGALSIEAISRGVEHATAIDIDKKAAEMSKENIKNLGITEKIKIIRASASGWSDNNPDKKFDLVFLAPPYDNLQYNLLVKLTKHLSKNGTLVTDWPGKLEPVKFDNLELVAVKNYGDAQLVYFKNMIDI